MLKIKNPNTCCSVCPESNVLGPGNGFNGDLVLTIKWPSQMCADTWSWFIFLPASILMSSEEKKGKNQTAEDNFFFFSRTVYFSPVSLGLQRECRRLMMKMMAAAKRAERACDSWRESDGQTRVPQAKTQLWCTKSPHKTCQTDNRGLNAQLVWMETLEGGEQMKTNFLCVP